MGLFTNEYPYTDYHELNLDWVLETIKNVVSEMDTFKALNTVTWQGEWSIDKSYTSWSIVDYNGYSYISTKPVPAGIGEPGEHPEYWTVCGNTSQVESLRIAIEALTLRVDTAENDITGLGTRLTTAEGSITSLNASAATASNNINTIYGKLVYFKRSGGVDDGTTDNSSVLNSIISTAAGSATTIVFNAGEFVFASDITVPENITFKFECGSIRVKSGYTITMNGYVDAPLYKIFNNTGSIKLSKNTEVYPEWFGAINDNNTDSTSAFRKAIDSLVCGDIVLQSGFHHLYETAEPTKAYKLTDTIEITKSEIGIKGINKAVVKSGANICFNIHGKLTTTGDLHYLDGLRIDNVVIFYTGTTTSTSDTLSSFNGITLRKCTRFKVTNTEVRNYGCGFYLKNNVNSFITDCLYVSPNSGEYNVGTYLNDNVDGERFANASVYLERNTYELTDNSRGVVAKGSVTSDLFVRHCEFAGGVHPIIISNMENGTEERLSYDIHITDCVIDAFTVTAIYIDLGGILAQEIEIDKNWMAGTNSNKCMELRGLRGSVVTHNTFNGVNSLGSVTAMYLYDCYGLSICDNVFCGCYNGILFADNSQGGHCTIANNVFNVTKLKTNITYNVCVYVPSTVGRINISNNSFLQQAGAQHTPFIIQSTVNVLNWNMMVSGFPSTIASGNVVDGQTT